MLITNQLNPGEMLAELFKSGRVPPEKTAIFSELRHDRNLCPRFAEQLSTMLGVYKAYGQNVHDIQSFRDDGIDVLMRYETMDGSERRAGIQIKSEDEFRKWEDKKLALPQILKAQHAMAVANVDIDDFYVVLCVDAVRHQGRIRTLCSELKNFRPCEIIEPVDVLNFYQARAMDLWAFTVRLLCAQDSVFKAATAEVDSEEPDMAFFLISLVCHAFGEGYDVDDVRLSDIWRTWEDFAGHAAGPQDRISGIVGQLENIGIIDHNGGSYTLRVNRLPKALSALYFDLRVRAGDLAGDLQDQLISLVALKSRLEPEEVRQS